MMNRIRCAFFFHDTDFYSGGSRSLLDIIDTYIEQKCVDIVAVFPSNKGSAIDYLKEKNIDIVCSHYYQIRYELSEGIATYLKRLPIRILRLAGSKVWVCSDTVAKLKKKNINIVYSNTSFILAGYWVAKSLNIPLIAHFREFGEEDHKIGVWFGRSRFYNIANQFDRIICISNALKEKYRNNINENIIRVVYDDLSKQYINWSSEELKPDVKNSFNILLAGNLTPGKGQLVALNKLANFIKKDSSIAIFIAGNPSDIKYVEDMNNLIAKCGIQNQVHFLGLVKDMNSLRKTMHIGIVLSDMEAFGRVTIEGMLSGMIMIAAKTGGSVELIQNGKNGFLVESDGKELERVVSFIKNNYEDTKIIQKKAFEFAKEFTNSRCSKILLENMKELVK